MAARQRSEYNDYTYGWYPLYLQRGGVDRGLEGILSRVVALIESIDKAYYGLLADIREVPPLCGCV